MSILYPKSTSRKIYHSLGTWIIAGVVISSVPAMATEEDLTDMSIEALMDIQVTSVSKKSQNLSDSAAAVFVITSEDIARSGATAIPELLRMVPGLNVARIDSSKWAISSRGFNSRFSDKLLVLMDGRSVYNTLYSGVYWEVQDTLLEDIERIEVVRGPGGTVWGANAVNGVINIITKHAGDTLGGLVTAGGGTEERVFAGGRYGATLAEGIYGRFYGKGTYRDSYQFENGEDAGDSWQDYRSGFRVDGSLASTNSFKVQGDIYKGDVEQRTNFPIFEAPYSYTGDVDVDNEGGNVLALWTQYLAGGSEMELQMYYDHTGHDEDIVQEESDTFDVEFKHRFGVGESHDIIWGANYRYIDQRVINTFWTALDPEEEKSHLMSFFVQDEYTAIQDTLTLTLGSKFEHNEYTGYEIQPSVRALYSPKKQHKFWGAIARAVRTPHRIERDTTLITVVVAPYVSPNPLPVPAAGGIQGNNDFDSQVVLAYESGYRFLANENLSFDLSVFYNDYDDLRSFTITPGFNGSYPELYNVAYNEGDGSSHGAELAVAWQVLESLKIDLAYSYINEDLEDIKVSWSSDAPTNQFSVRANWKATDKFTVDVWGRYIDNIAVMHVSPYEDSYYTIEDYLTADVQITYKPTPNLDLALVGQNLIEESHEEYVQEFWSTPTEVERGVYLKATYRF